jgi:peptidoglycan/LPS O-acetylase OafA/YrhL
MLQFVPSWVGILTLVVSVILPALVGLVTKVVTSPNKKAIILTLLSALTGFGGELLNALVNHTAYNVFAGIITFVTAFIIGVAVHFGFLKPTGISTKLQAVGTTTYSDPSTPTGGAPLVG